MSCDIMVPVKKGVLACPYCDRKLKVRITPETTATGLQVYCDRCHRSLEVNIDRGLCRLSPCPDNANA